MYVYACGGHIRRGKSLVERRLGELERERDRVTERLDSIERLTLSGAELRGLVTETERLSSGWSRRFDMGRWRSDTLC